MRCAALSDQIRKSASNIACGMEWSEVEAQAAVGGDIITIYIFQIAGNTPQRAL